jgi:Flp pilus assembly protein TadG
MTLFRKLARNERGSSVVEMALSVPIILSMIYGIFTVGLLFDANAGIQQALGEGARYATVCTSVTSAGVCSSPTDDQIVTRMRSKVFGMNVGTFNTPTVTTPDSASCSNCRDLSVTYTVTPNFLFFSAPAVTMTRTKRVYLAT